MAYVNSDLNNSLTPTIVQVKKYIRRANDLGSGRDVRPLMSFLQRLPQIDLTLLGIMETRKLAPLGYDYTIEMPEGITATSDDEKRIAAMKTRFERANIRSIFNAIMNGILFGVSATRLQWGNSDFGTMVVKKTSHELTELDIDPESDDHLRLLSTDTKTSKLTYSALDPETHIVMRHNPLDGIAANYVGSYMRTNMLYVMLKYWDVFNWAQSNEKFGDPLIYAQYRKGAAPEEVAVVIDGLSKMGADGYAAFSDDIKIQLAEAMKTGSLQARKELNESLTREITISLLGQTLTTDVKDRGSFAAAKVHNYVREDILWGDLIKFQAVMNNQYIQRDFVLNYGEPKNVFPVFRFKTEEREDAEANARIISELRAAQVPLKRSEVYQKTGFTPPEPTDDVI